MEVNMPLIYESAGFNLSRREENKSRIFKGLYRGHAKTRRKLETPAFFSIQQGKHKARKRAKHDSVKAKIRMKLYTRFTIIIF